MTKYLDEGQNQPRALVHVDGCSCGTCGKGWSVDPRLQQMRPSNPDIADGMEDPNLALNYDPMFSSVLGSGVSRRDMLKMAGVAAMGGMGGMLSSTSALAQQKKADGKKFTKPFDPVVKIGYIPITDAATLLVAHEMGFFKKQGIESEPPTLIRGWSPLVEAFSAQRFNLTHMLIPVPIYMRYNNNFPVKITAWNHTNGSGVIVSKKAGIKTVKDLGGKQFAVPYWYSIHNIISQKMMRDAGLTPVIRPQNAKLAPNEVNLLVLNPPDMPPALAAGQIDGYCVAEPFNALGEAKAGGEMLRFTGDVWKGHPCCVVIMHEDDVMDPARAEWAQGIHNAIVETQLYIAGNRKAVAHMLSKDGKKYLPFDKEVVDRAMNFYEVADYSQPLAIKHPEWEQSRINFQGWPFPSATKQVASEMKQTLVGGDLAFLNKITPDFVAKDLVQYTYIKKALDKNPKWKWDLSVPQKGNPFERKETILL
ncbi:ABC transporter substrate-binding protein [Betaproteobacteria bacterium SCN2]|nr:ABC transporter substrate-binding protein [Betaproteobacteria bacterium SCN2]